MDLTPYFLQSTDMNWYTKRLTLLAIYKSSELAMMNDKSDDFKETWEFLDRCGHKLIFVHLNCQFVCTKRNSCCMEGIIVTYTGFFGHFEKKLKAKKTQANF